MAQYIDKDALIAEIERRMKLRQSSYGKYSCVSDFVAFEELEYLHDEFLPTLEVKEVDLEKELESWRHNHFHGRRDKEASGEYLERISQLDLAKHFFELGLKVQHSSIGIPNIEDIFEEEGIEPNSKDAKIFKECYYMALEKLQAQKGE
jgi:hypothetical protein